MSEKGILEELIERARRKIRELTPGGLPTMQTRHPVLGLVHDIQRFVRRKISKFLRG